MTENTIPQRKQNEEQLHSNENMQPPKDDKHEVTYLSEMYEDWFLDYASYVILERAVPYVNDGLKPVQRRILHAMKQMDDGRYNKVANIIGNTMQYHPHGDASIGDALVQLGQKDLLIDMQGNWGNIFTGDRAAASRYIEARLSKFALDVVFNPKTTEWKQSYDGRNKEPVTLPVKFPLLLAQGVEGIAVGLSSKIVPHNFNELIDAAIASLKGKTFELYPDFPTGGYVDVTKYTDGQRGGAIKVRAKIEKLDNKTLAIREIPFGRTTSSLIDSIIKANEKGKIKIKKVDDNTAGQVEILIHLGNGVSSDKTIDALYAFSDCEISISPNACIVEDDKPLFTGISEILRKSAENAVELLKMEQEIRKAELENAWHFASLEKIFIEERIYKDKKFEESKNMDAAIAHVDERLEPWKPKLKREITRDDILRLMEIKMARILRFNTDKANAYIQGIEDEIQEVIVNLENIVPFTINWFKQIKSRYGKAYPRKTEIRNFENIVAAKVVVANQKLYVDYEEGFMGTSLKKAEYVCDCSDIDDVIVFRKDGTYFITKVPEKAFIGKNILYLQVFKKNDMRTIYNTVYRDGKSGVTFMKRFAVTGVTRDKEYNITQGTPNSRVLYFTVNPNGEAEVIKVLLKPKPRLRKLTFEADFGEMDVKGRQARGNVLSKNTVQKIQLKEKGVSTLGGRKIWFDQDVLRLNADGRGKYLGEFHGEDMILALTKDGHYQLYNFDLENHFDDDILIIEKFEQNRVLSIVYLDAEQGFHYVKRFQIDPATYGKKLRMIGENPENKLISITWVRYPRLEIEFSGKHSNRDNEIVEVDEFIGIKSFKAKGKRLSSYEIGEIKEIEPVVRDEHDKPEDDALFKDEEETVKDEFEEVPMEVERKDNEPESDDNQMSLF